MGVGLTNSAAANLIVTHMDEPEPRTLPGSKEHLLLRSPGLKGDRTRLVLQFPESICHRCANSRAVATRASSAARWP